MIPNICPCSFVCFYCCYRRGPRALVASLPLRPRRPAVAAQPEIKEAHDPSVYIQLMVRYVAADEIWLSPQYGRDNAVISFIVAGTNKYVTGSPEEFEMYASLLQRICMGPKYHGRPHWGKMNWLTGEDLAGAYPATFESFRQLRRELDPAGIFLNDYTATRLSESL